MVWHTIFEHGVNMPTMILGGLVPGGLDPMEQEQEFVKWLAVARPEALSDAVVHWRARCLKAERNLGLALEVVAGLRSDLVAATGSGLGRK